MVCYPELAAEIARCGIKKKDVAATIGISERSLYSKMSGKTDFTWKEIQKISETFFPSRDKDNLFRRADDQGA